MENEEIKRLEAEAGAIEAELNAQPEGVAALPGEVHQSAGEAEALDLVRFAVVLFVPLFPSLGQVYNDMTQKRLASVLATLMEKYGLTVGGLFERYGVEINFAVVAVPLTLETVKAIRHDTAEREKQATKEAEKDGKGVGNGEVKPSE